MKKQLFSVLVGGALTAYLYALPTPQASGQSNTGQSTAAQDVQKYDQTIKGDVKNRAWLKSEITRLQTETKHVDAGLAEARAAKNQARVTELEKEHERISHQLAERENELKTLDKNTANEVKERKEKEKEAGVK